LPAGKKNDTLIKEGEKVSPKTKNRSTYKNFIHRPFEKCGELKVPWNEGTKKRVALR